MGSKVVSKVGSGVEVRGGGSGVVIRGGFRGDDQGQRSGVIEDVDLDFRGRGRPEIKTRE